MQTENLVKMANQISLFFESMPEREEAQTAIAQHLRSFWEPRMRRRLLDALAAGEAQALRALVCSALQRHRDFLLGASQQLEALPGPSESSRRG